MAKALLIIDVQYDFLPPSGSLAVPGGNDLIPLINLLRTEGKFDRIFLTQDWHPHNHCSFYETNKDVPGSSLFKTVELPNIGLQMQWPVHCVQNTQGAKIHTGLIREQTDILVQKGKDEKVDMYSGFFPNEQIAEQKFFNSELDAQLKLAGVKEVYCVGLAFDYCVGSTALDAVKLGYKTYVIEDATRAVDPTSIEAGAMRTRLQIAGVTLMRSTDILATQTTFENLRIVNPDGINMILGQSHFIKTAEDLYEIMITSSTCIKFGLAFCEASARRLIRYEGNDPDLIELAKTNALLIGAGHSFIIFMKNAFPINVLNAIKTCPEVCNIFCATANQVDVVIAKSKLGRGIVGVIDGETPLAIEQDEHKIERSGFLREIVVYKR